MPATLRRKVVRTIVRPLLDKVHIFNGLTGDLLDSLSELFRPVELPSGEVTRAFSCS